MSAGLEAKVFQVVVLQDVFSCRLVPAVGIFLADKGLVNVSRFVGITQLSGINRHGNQSRPFVNVFLVVDYRLVEEVRVDI